MQKLICKSNLQSKRQGLLPTHSPAQQPFFFPPTNLTRQRHNLKQQLLLLLLLLHYHFSHSISNL
jgi:hypothetical protein